MERTKGVTKLEKSNVLFVSVYPQESANADLVVSEFEKAKGWMKTILMDATRVKAWRFVFDTAENAAEMHRKKSGQLVASEEGKPTGMLLMGFMPPEKVD